MYKIIKIALLVIGLISAVLWFFMPETPENLTPEIVTEIANNSPAVDAMFIIMWIAIAVAAALALVFGLQKMISTPGGLKKALFALGGLVVLFIAGYALSSTAEAEAVKATFAGKDIEPTVGTVKNIGMLLNVFFAMVLVAIGLMVIPGVKRLIGK